MDACIMALFQGISMNGGAVQSRFRFALTLCVGLCHSARK
jgi:hypothetical protein